MIFIAALVATTFAPLRLPHAAATALAAEGPNLVPNPSLEEQSGDLPVSWAKGRWGTNTAAFRYPVAGIDGAKAAEVELTQYTSGDAKWYFKESAVTPGATYAFSDRYQGTVPSYVTVQYHLADGSFAWRDIGAGVPSAAWHSFQATFTAPANATHATVFHLIKAVGLLRVDDYALRQVQATPTTFPEGMVSLTFDDGWMSSYTAGVPILDAAGLKSTHYIISGRLGEDFPGYVKPKHVLDMQAKGHEIGAHSRTHPDLTTLSEAEMREEIRGSRDDLLAIGAKNVDNFAYPLGAFNATVERITRESGFASGRSTWNGTVKKTDTDLYNLRRRGLQVGTSVDTVRQWIDEARANKEWLILVFHRIDASGTTYSTTPADLQAIVEYLKKQAVPVVTVAEGLAIKNS